MADTRYSFNVEWYDPNAGFARKYQLTFHPADNTIEMYDIKNRRPFLKRTHNDNVKLSDLYVGSVVNIYSRQLTVTGYADDFTRRNLNQINESTCALIKPCSIASMGKILSIICSSGFQINNIKFTQISRSDAEEFYAEHKGRSFFGELVSFMSSGPLVALELMGQDAIKSWRALIGPTDPAKAREEAPNTIRAQFGADGTRNACHGSDSTDSASREIDFWFGPRSQASSSFVGNNCTLCVVKPHAISKAGDIINQILDAGYDISAMRSFTMDKANAEEFLEVYKGVVTEYPEMVQQMSSGTCIALEVRGEDVGTRFREFAGPADPEIARHLRPKTLRAIYGNDKIQNAVHCTDLAEDGQLEVEYFFSILA